MTIVGPIFEKLSEIVFIEPFRTILANLEPITAIFTHTIALLSENYDSGDFCRGLIFGKEGTEMLKLVAEANNFPRREKYKPATVEEMRARIEKERPDSVKV